MSARKQFTLCFTPKVMTAGSGGFNPIAVKLRLLSTCRGGVCPPECIHQYPFLNVIGQANPAPTVGGNAIGFLSLTAMGFNPPLR
ncbi:hypothetical protein [Phocaeicola sp.]